MQVKDNHEYLENVLRQFLNGDPSEEQLRFMISLLLPILADWWPTRNEVLMLFWEYFHKKLNSSFFLPGSAPSTLAVIRYDDDDYDGVDFVLCLLTHLFTDVADR